MLWLRSYMAPGLGVALRCFAPAAAAANGGATSLTAVEGFFLVGLAGPVADGGLGLRTNASAATWAGAAGVVVWGAGTAVPRWAVPSGRTVGVGVAG